MRRGKTGASSLAGRLLVETYRNVFAHLAHEEAVGESALQAQQRVRRNAEHADEQVCTRGAGGQIEA